MCFALALDHEYTCHLSNHHLLFDPATKTFGQKLGAAIGAHVG
jgi:hypothetical protein